MTVSLKRTILVINFADCMVPMLLIAISLPAIVMIAAELSVSMIVGYGVILPSPIGLEMMKAADRIITNEYDESGAF